MEVNRKRRKYRNTKTKEREKVKDKTNHWNAKPGHTHHSE
jgi:hypothetical protein